MSCETCGATMQNIAYKTYHCPRCGTTDVQGRVTTPAVVERVRKFLGTLGPSWAGLASQMGMFEAAFKPEDRPVVSLIDQILRPGTARVVVESHMIGEPDNRPVAGEPRCRECNVLLSEVAGEFGDVCLDCAPVTPIHFASEVDGCAVAAPATSGRTT